MPTLDIQCLISGEQTGGKAAVFEEIVPPGGGPPRHAHRFQHEIFHVIDGRLEFEIGGRRSELGPGESAVIAPGVVHAFRNAGDAPVRIHFELLPAGDSEEAFDRMVNDGDNIEDIAGFFDRYEIELAGPPMA